jgi:hypothetical protein
MNVNHILQLWGLESNNFLKLTLSKKNGVRPLQWTKTSFSIQFLYHIKLHKPKKRISAFGTKMVHEKITSEHTNIKFTVV